MNLSGLDVLARSDDFEDRAATYELRAWQWSFLHALDGKAELRDVAMIGGVDLELALDFVHECQSASLVHAVSMTLAQYRSSIGTTSAKVESPVGHVAYDDDLSANDTLGSYETAVPAWMVEHHDVVEPVAEEHHSETSAEHHGEPVAEHHEEYVAQHFDEPVAEHNEEPVAEPDHEPVAEYAHEPVAEAAAEHDSERIPEHHDAPVAEQHDDAAYQNAPAIASVDPAAFPEPAYAHDASADAAATVAGLVSMGSPIEHATLPEPPSTNGHAVSFSFDNADHTPSTNGHAAAASWQPMSLVTSVDDASASHESPATEPAHADASTEVPDGISIRLSSHEDADYEHFHTYVEPEPVSQEKGSISFSLSPEDEAHPEESHAEESHEATPVAHAPAAVSMSFGAPDPVVDHSAAPAPEQRPLMSPPETQPVAASTSSATSDIVGSLIARALTFRIK